MLGIGFDSWLLLPLVLNLRQSKIRVAAFLCSTRWWAVQSTQVFLPGFGSRNRFPELNWKKTLQWEQDALGKNAGTDQVQERKTNSHHSQKTEMMWVCEMETRGGCVFVHSNATAWAVGALCLASWIAEQISCCQFGLSSYAILRPFSPCRALLIRCAVRIHTFTISNSSGNHGTWRQVMYSVFWWQSFSPSQAREVECQILDRSFLSSLCSRLVDQVFTKSFGIVEQT